jgi:hypothetical protein
VGRRRAVEMNSYYYNIMSAVERSASDSIEVFLKNLGQSPITARYRDNGCPWRSMSVEQFDRTLMDIMMIASQVFADAK